MNLVRGLSLLFGNGARTVYSHGLGPARRRRSSPPRSASC